MILRGVGVGDVRVDVGQEITEGEVKQSSLFCVYMLQNKASMSAPHVRMCCVSFPKNEAKIESV